MQNGGDERKMENSAELFPRIKYSSITPSGGIPSFPNDGIAVLVPNDGSFSLSINDEDFEVQAGEFAVLNVPFENAEGCRTKGFAVFIPSLLLCGQSFLLPQILSVQKYARILVEVEESFQTDCPFLQNSLVFALLNTLTENGDLIKKENKSDIPLQERLVPETKEYLDIHYREPLNVSNLCEMFAVSPSHLQHLFKKQMGMGLVEYLNKHRVFCAENLLRNTHLPICDIAEKVGFTDYGYFSRVYKKYRGISPTEFRKTING